MKLLAAIVLAFTLMLSPFEGPVFAEKGKGNGGHGPDQGAKPHKPHPGSNEKRNHARGPERSAEAHNKQDKDDDGDASAEPEHEEAETIGICHATGNGSYVFIRVSENARGHLVRHGDDILDTTGPESCPETVAEAD